MELRWVEFGGVRFLAIGDEHDYALATEEQYTTGSPSFALVTNGVVLRYQRIIGHESEITVVGPAKITEDPEKIMAGLASTKWKANRG